MGVSYTASTMLLKIPLLTLLPIVAIIATTEAFSLRREKPSFGVNDILPCGGKQSKVWSKYDGDYTVWTYFTMSMSWPTTFCLTQKEAVKCKIPENLTSWSIHGLWPSYSPGRGPEKCDKKAVFDTSKVKSIADKMNKYWPNLLVDEGYYSFWGHEWCTHGTCAVNVTSVDDEYKYFEQTIELFQDINLYSALYNAGITPSNETYYTAENITRVFQEHYLVRPLLTCYHDEGTGDIYLHEIHLCLNKALGRENCSPSTSNNCNGKIRYPPIERKN